VGHVRYSTAGGSRIQNAQPIVVRYARGDLAIAHNGNLTNAHELRNRLVEEGALFQTTSDSEVIVHLIARSRHETVDAQVDDALSHLEGAFSLVISVGDTLYAAVDARGFRPLVLGRKDGGHRGGLGDLRPGHHRGRVRPGHPPGEVLRIREKVTPLRSLPPAPRPAPCVFELVYFARPDSRIWGTSVDRARRAFGRRSPRSTRWRRTASLPFRTRPTPRRWGTPRPAGSPTNWGSCGTTTWAGPSSSRPRPTGTSGPG
jgi:amidophosphoribosyltransferase